MEQDEADRFLRYNVIFVDRALGPTGQRSRARPIYMNAFDVRLDVGMRDLFIKSNRRL